MSMVKKQSIILTISHNLKFRMALDSGDESTRWWSILILVKYQKIPKMPQLD